uniref:Uncharacterized protein n=1 Tax=Setaria viridis TaxID=4556 RepID=A0A4U6WC33_SETVI|nr:hypothetical protein SEVIR_1G191500v2 [Setaria viridis]
MELEDLRNAASYVMDMVQPETDPIALTPILDRLTIAPGRLKELLKDTAMESKIEFEWSAQVMGRSMSSQHLLQC